MTTVTIRDLYHAGLDVRAVVGIQPNTAILMPIRRPSLSAGGVITVVDENKGTLGTNCLAYSVVSVGVEQASADQHPQTWLPIEVGDVVVVRNSMLEPLHPNLEPLSIHRMHVLALISLRE